MKVTVITATYNNAAVIADCLESVRDQTYPNIEHIIIDGNSTDGTLGVVERFGDGIAKVVSLTTASTTP